MKLLDKFNQAIQGWLFKEEIEVTEQRRAEGLPVTPEEFEAERLEQLEKMERAVKTAMDKINAEDHSRPPSSADINRYFGYHENYVANMKGLEENVDNLWANAPKETIRFEDYIDEAQEKGWAYLRETCGMPQGDLSKPRTPWVAGSVRPTEWTATPQEFGNTKEEVEPEKPKVRKRGI